MPKNDVTNDKYNPPSNLSHDFEEVWFDDLETNELFWQTNLPQENNPWRKQTDTTALNLKQGTIHTFKPRTKLYQRIQRLLVKEMVRKQMRI